MSDAIKYKRIFNNSSSASGGMTPAELLRLQTLENNEIKVAYFTSINSDAGTIVTPTGATILLDQFPGGVDAYVSTFSGTQPSGNNPITAGSAIVDVTSFDTSGNYVLTGIPSAYPVALIYILKIDAKDWSNLVTDNILEWEQYTYTGTAPIVVNANTKDISIPQANGSTDGFLDSGDWTTFNNKQAALGYTAENTANKDATGGYAGLTLFKINFKNAANTFTNFLTNATTAIRTWTFPDKDGTVAMLSDVPMIEIMTGSQSLFSPADSTTNYISALTTLTPGTAATRSFQLPTGTVKAAWLFVDPTGALGSNEAVTYNLYNVTDAVSVGLLGTLTYDARGNAILYSGLSLAVLNTKYYSVQIVNPAFATNPTNVATIAKLIVYP